MNLEVVLLANVTTFPCAWAAETGDRAGGASWDVVTAYVIMLAAILVCRRDPQATVRDLLVYVRHATLPRIVEDGQALAPDLVAALESLADGLSPSIVVPMVMPKWRASSRPG